MDVPGQEMLFAQVGGGAAAENIAHGSSVLSVRYAALYVLPLRRRDSADNSFVVSHSISQSAGKRTLPKENNGRKSLYPLSDVSLRFVECLIFRAFGGFFRLQLR